MSEIPFKRAARVGSEVYHIIADVCQNQLADPRVRGIQLTGSEMTDDLQIIKIYYYIDGDKTRIKKCDKGLESAKGFMKRAIAKNLALRLIPEIFFYYDEGIQNAEKMDLLLRELKEKGTTGQEEEGE